MPTKAVAKTTSDPAKVIRRVTDQTAEWLEYANLLRRPRLTKPESERLAELLGILAVPTELAAVHVVALAEESRLAELGAGAESAWAELENVAAEMLAATARHREEIVQHARRVEALEAQHSTSWARYQTAVDSRRQLDGTKRKFPALFGTGEKEHSGDILPAAVANAMLKAGATNGEPKRKK